jgi:hypothetical protein
MACGKVNMQGSKEQGGKRMQHKGRQWKNEKGFT